MYPSAPPYQSNLTKPPQYSNVDINPPPSYEDIAGSTPPTNTSIPGPSSPVPPYSETNTVLKPENWNGANSYMSHLQLIMYKEEMGKW